MFLQVSVILFTGGCACSQGVWSRGGAWSRGVPGPGAACSGGFLLREGGECLVETAPRTAIAAGGTHPTGMHSCLIATSPS